MVEGTDPYKLSFDLHAHAHTQIIKNKVRMGHSPTLTLLVGLIDGPDFSIGPGGQDFYKSLFICAGSLESPHKGHVSCSSDPEY